MMCLTVHCTQISAASLTQLFKGYTYSYIENKPLIITSSNLHRVFITHALLYVVNSIKLRQINPTDCHRNTNANTQWHPVQGSHCSPYQCT